MLFPKLVLFLLYDWSPRYRFLEYKYLVCTINVPAFFHSIRKRRVRGIGYDFFSLYVGTSYEISRPFLLEEKEESILLLRGRTKTENKLPERFYFPPITFVAVWNEKGRESPVSDRMSRWHPVVRERAKFRRVLFEKKKKRREGGSAPPRWYVCEETVQKWKSGLESAIESPFKRYLIPSFLRFLHPQLESPNVLRLASGGMASTHHRHNRNLIPGSLAAWTKGKQRQPPDYL